MANGDPDFVSGASGPDNPYDSSATGLGLTPAYLASNVASATGGSSVSGSGILIQKNDVDVAAESKLDIKDGTEIAWTITDDAPNTRVKVTPTIANGVFAPAKLIGYPADATKFLNGNGGWTAKAAYGNNPADPGGDSSGSFVMAGINATITPTSNGRLMIVVPCKIASSGGVSCHAYLATGTGAAPANGAAASGTSRTPTLTSTGAYVTFTALVTGLVVGTTYWIDLAFQTDVGGVAATVSAIMVSAAEI